MLSKKSGLRARLASTLILKDGVMGDQGSSGIEGWGGIIDGGTRF